MSCAHVYARKQPAQNDINNVEYNISGTNLNLCFSAVTDTELRVEYDYFFFSPLHLTIYE
jgi:hypothetical protein